MRADRGRAAAAAGVFLLVAVAWAAPASLSPASTVPDVGDPLHLAYVMAWDAHQLARRPWALFESNSFHPYPHSLAFGDHLLPEALLVAPINWVTGNAILASNVGVVAALALSAFAMFLLVRDATGSAGAALVAGLAYAFNSFTRHELLRIHVLNLQWWPLALLFLDRYARWARARDAALFAATLLLQGLSGAYYLICTALVAPLWLVVAYGARARRPTCREATVLAGALALAALPGVLVLWPYVVQLRAMGFEKPLVDGPDLACFVQPPPGQTLWGGVHVFGGCFGVAHFVGFVGLALTALGALLVASRRVAAGARPVALAALGTAVAGVALSLGPIVRVGGHALVRGPFALLYAAVPFVRGMDGSRRMAVLAILGGAILLGHAVAWLSNGPRRAAVVVAALAVVVPLEHWTPPTAAAAVPAGRAVPAAYAWLAAQPATALVELPILPEIAKRYRALYLYFSTYHWRPIPIGRTSFYPPAHDFLAWSLRDFPDETSLTLLDRLGIHTLLVHPMAWAASERTERLAALEAGPRLRLVRAFDDAPDRRDATLGLGAERVYELTPGPAPRKLCTPADELPRKGWRLATHRSPVRRTDAFIGLRYDRWAWAREWRVPWRADWATDGDRRTAWATEDTQTPGDALELRWPEPENVAAVTLDMGYPFDEFPHDLALIGDRGSDERARLVYADGPDERWETLAALLEHPRDARMVLRLAEPRRLSSLTLKLAGSEQDQAWPRWSVPEVRVFRECRPPD